MSDLNNTRNAHKINTFCSDRCIIQRTCYVTLDFSAQTYVALTRIDLDGLRSPGVSQCEMIKAAVEEGVAATKETPDLAKCQRRIAKMHKFMRARLEPALGFADDRLTRRLVFHPQTRSPATPTEPLAAHEVYPF